MGGVSVLRRAWRLVFVAGLGLVLWAALAAPAEASELLARDTSEVRLTIDGAGRAVVRYRRQGNRHHVRAWGAVNAAGSTGGEQVRFQKRYGTGAASGPVGTCRAYNGPSLPFLVSACRAPDGSYWALQEWQRSLPNYGVSPWKPLQQARELHLSHWTGEPARIEVWLDWVRGGSVHHLFGRFTYGGEPVHGFGSTERGQPLDRFGRNLYLDTWNSAYGSGWRRENSFLAHNPSGNFCYGFYARALPDWYPEAGSMRPEGNGAWYRLSAMGPGVTPVVMWHGPALVDFNPSDGQHVRYEQYMNQYASSIHQGDTLCAQQ